MKIERPISVESRTSLIRSVDHMSTSERKSPAAMPSQVPFIIGNEAAERFSFYGMRNILTIFLAQYLFIDLAEPLRGPEAKEVFHIFVMGVYFFPLLGGWIADRLWGKYQTIFWLSILYFVGQATLVFFVDSKIGFYWGLVLVALGSGGIKACVSAFVGDQFDQSNKHLAKIVFDAFYWSINFGSFFASLIIPRILDQGSARWAFGIPAILMGAAIIVFWGGRRRYVVVPPAPADPHSFLRVCWTTLTRQTADQPMRRRMLGSMMAGLGLVGAVTSVAAASVLGTVAAICLAIVVFFFGAGLGVWIQIDNAKQHHPIEAVTGVQSVLRLLIIFALVTPFWSLFDQKASTWVLQAGAMKLPNISWFSSPSQMQAMNPLLVMLLIPFNNAVLFPLIEKLGLKVTPLRRMGTGIAFSGLSWIVVGSFQVTIDRGEQISILWQILPYALLTFGEVLVGATGLEFAYSQAPARMKSVLMSFWLLAVTIGNLWVIVVNNTVKSPRVTSMIQDAGYGVTAFQMYFFAGFALVAAMVFGLYTRQYQEVDHYRKLESV